MKRFEIPMKVALLEKHIEDFYVDLDEFVKAFGVLYGYLQTVDIDRRILDDYAHMYRILLDFKRNYPMNFRGEMKQLTQEELAELKETVNNFFENDYKPFIFSLDGVRKELLVVYNIISQLPQGDDYKIKYEGLLDDYGSFFADMLEYADALTNLLVVTYGVDKL